MKTKGLCNNSSKISKIFNGIGISLVALGIASSSKVEAASITYKFTGSVNSVTNTTGFLNNSISTGTPFTASFSFDSDSVDNSETESNFGSYNGLSVKADVGNFSFESNSQRFDLVEILVDSSAESNGYLYTAFNAENEISLDLSLFDSKGTAITSKLLPGQPPLLSSFTNNFFTIFSSEPSNDIFDISGSITSITSVFNESENTPQPVPEPSTGLGIMALLVIGAGLKLQGKKKSTNKTL